MEGVANITMKNGFVVLKDMYHGCARVHVVVRIRPQPTGESRLFRLMR
jgi:hypothetical protein